MVPAGTSPAVGTPANVLATPMTWLFTRTTSAGVTVRAFLSGESVDPCPPSLACAQPVVVPGPVTCPKGAVCAQPVTEPATVPAGVTGTATGTAVPGSAGGSSGVAGGSSGSAGGSTGSSGGSTGSGGGSTGTTVTSPAPTPSYGCTMVTVELSTDRAVTTSIGPGRSGVRAQRLGRGHGPRVVRVRRRWSGSLGGRRGGCGGGLGTPGVGQRIGARRHGPHRRRRGAGHQRVRQPHRVGAGRPGCGGATTATVPADQQMGNLECTVAASGGPAPPPTTTTTLPGSPPTTSTTGPVPPTAVPARPSGSVGTAADGG